jgi:hypothetical protein
MLEIVRHLVLMAAAAGATGGVAGPGSPVSVSITRADCERLVPYVPAPDVAYQPGVDVNGGAVVPADLDGGVSVALPDVFAFDLVISPVEGKEFDNTGLPLGRVVVLSDGRAYFNGQPLQSDEQAELAARCQRVLAGPAD